MSSFKRKREDYEEDTDEEEPAYGRQILPVANLPEDFSDEPMDGLQYLFVVRRDARQLPDTVRAPNPYEMPEVPIPEENSEPQLLPGHLHLPSLEWRELFEYRFRNFRKNFNQPTVNIGPVNVGQQRLVPDKKDRDFWWAFLSGKPESEWNPSKRAKAKLKKQQQTYQGMRSWTDVSNNEERLPSVSRTWNNDEGEVEEVLRVDPAETLPSPVGTPAPVDHLEPISQPSPMLLSTSMSASEDISLPREPTTQLLKLIDERTALHLLMYFTHWINVHLKSPDSDDHVPTNCHARWILSLLSRIDDFVSADDMNLLRNLARACLSLLKLIREKYQISSSKSRSFTAEIMTEISCWLIVSTVADVWKQKDLWMAAEEMLKSFCF